MDPENLLSNTSDFMCSVLSPEEQDDFIVENLAALAALVPRRAYMLHKLAFNFMVEMNKSDGRMHCDAPGCFVCQFNTAEAFADFMMASRHGVMADPSLN